MARIPWSDVIDIVILVLEWLKHFLKGDESTRGARITQAKNALSELLR